VFFVHFVASVRDTNTLTRGPMDAALQRRIQRYGWDRAAESYERSWAEQLKPAQDRLLDMAALQTGERVIDIACGTGLISLRAAEAVGPSGHVLATDISDRMVERVASETRQLGLGHVTTRRLGAEQLDDVPDSDFDVALSGLGLMYVPDVGAALTEMRRVLRPGGRAVAAVWGARARCGWADIFPIVESRVKSDVCPMFFQLGTGPALELAFKAAGFTGVRADRLSTTLYYETGDDAADAAFAGGPVAMAYSRFDDETRAAARAEYISSIAAFRTGDGYAIPGEFVVARGGKRA
jgi:ubiquinone/menaquinone biosynthesis C-methylase UbiE